MKKGISLIVLVITIIVMIIIATAIILSLNSSSVTGKATWAQISSDRANFQSEFAVILAQVMADENVTDNFDGVNIDDLKDEDDSTDTAYETWVKAVNGHKSGILSVEEPTDETNPAGIKVIATITADQATAFGLTVNDAGTGVVSYDWIKIETPSTGD